MNGRLVPRAALTQGQRDAMFALLQTHFPGVARMQFERDLYEKNWVILLEADSDHLLGFTTFLFYRADFRGEPIQVVYSGDTIVDQEAWGSSTLARTWIRSVLSVAYRADAAKIYWLLISSGYRTYRFLPVFFRNFWPRYDAPMPQAAQALLDHLAGTRFGVHYNHERGIVRLPSPQVLREDLRRVPTGRLRDPHIAFFCKRNAGCVNGEELACLCELSVDNLTRAGRRMTEPERGPTHATSGALA